MKKNIFVAIAVFAASAAFTQQKQTKPPPPPPKVNLENFVPPPPPPKPPSRAQAVNSSKNLSYQQFLNRNPTVKQIKWADKNIVHIHLKSGKQEIYDLKKEKDKEDLKNKYGELPMLPPPPPKVNLDKFVPPTQEKS